MSQSTLTQINWHDEVLKRKEEMLDELKRFLQIESVLDESTAGPNAPFGKEIAKALEFMLSLGEKDGFRTKNVDGYAGHIEMGEGEELIGVLGHVDVVPAGDGWTSPPFAPEIRDGKLFARGAVDDKGPTMAAYFAMKIIKELELPLSKRVRLIMGTDEESLWRCMAYYFKKEEMPVMGFTPDADFPIIHAEKGFLDIKLVGEVGETAEASEDMWILKEWKAGQRVNMVPDLASATLVGNGDVFELKEKVQEFLLNRRIQGYAEENNEGVTIVVKGQAHHGSEPHRGLNAALELARLLQDVPLDPEGSRYIRMINELFVDSFFGEKLGIAQEEKILGPLTVNAGVFGYEQGGQRFARINVRYPLCGDHEEILQAVKERVEPYGLSIADVDHKAVHYCEENHPLVQTLMKVYEEQTGEPAQLLTTGGGTYARVLKKGVAFGPVFPGSEETAHQRDEYIAVDDLLKATAIYAQSIYELAK